MRRLPMRKIGEALRLRAGGRTMREIASSLGVGRSTVSEYLKRAEDAGLSWPLPDDVVESDLEAWLFQPSGGETRHGLAPPDWLVHCGDRTHTLNTAEALKVDHAKKP